MENQKWQVLKSKYQLKTPYLKVRLDECKNQTNQKINYYVVEKSNTVGIVALTKDKKIILQKQYRHPLKKWIIQIPAGHIEKDEQPKIAVQRELLEETGYKAETIIKINYFYPCSATFNNKWTLYLGLNAAQAQKPKTDAEENLQIFLVSRKQAVKMVRDGQIQDMDSALAILAAQEYLKRNYLFLIKQFLTSLKHHLPFSHSYSKGEAIKMEE